MLLRPLSKTIAVLLLSILAPAPTGQAEHGKPLGPVCAHKTVLTWGLNPEASDHLRCAGVTAGEITQTIGNAPSSGGTHAQDGTADGDPYCAAVDVSVNGMSDGEVHEMLNRMASQGFAAYYRKPAADGWRSSELAHIHAIYAGAKMKHALREQVRDWLNGRNGLSSHGSYSFYKPTLAQKNLVSSLFNQYNDDKLGD